MSLNELTRGRALDMLLTRFSKHGWHDDGEAADALDQLYSRGGNVAPADVANQFPAAFLANNGVSRGDLARTIEEVLGDVRIVSTGKMDPGSAAVTTTSITLSTGGGDFTGDIAGGHIVKSQSLQAMGDNVARLLAGDYGHDAEVRDIVDSEAGGTEKESRLRQLLVGVRGWSADVAGTVIAKLLTGR